MTRELLSVTVAIARYHVFLGLLCWEILTLFDPKQKAFGTNYGLTAKVPKDAFHLSKGKPKEHAADNGSGTVIHREFCDNCGSFILEYGVNTKPLESVENWLTRLIGRCQERLSLHLCWFIG
jgi:hypothetical protein